MTVQELVDAGLTYCGRLAAGRTAGVVESQVGLATLNAMLDAWRTERLLVNAELRTLFNIVSGQQEYIIGLAPAPVADFAIERPEQIHRAEFVFTNVTPNVETPIRILTSQEWAAMSPKTLTSTITTMLWYQPLVPNGKITLWPKPTQNWKIGLWTWSILAQFAALTDVVIIPPGYLEAIQLNLAIRLALKYPDTAVLAPGVVELAKLAKSNIKTMNAPNLEMRIESAALGTNYNQGRSWNIFSNSYNP